MALEGAQESPQLRLGTSITPSSVKTSSLDEVENLFTNYNLSTYNCISYDCISWKLANGGPRREAAVGLLLIFFLI